MPAGNFKEYKGEWPARRPEYDGLAIEARHIRARKT